MLAELLDYEPEDPEALSKVQPPAEDDLQDNNKQFEDPNNRAKQSQKKSTSAK